LTSASSSFSSPYVTSASNSTVSPTSTASGTMKSTSIINNSSSAPSSLPQATNANILTIATNVKNRFTFYPPTFCLGVIVNRHFVRRVSHRLFHRLYLQAHHRNL